MPYATNGGVRIFHQEEGSGSPLVIAHGFGSSSEFLYPIGAVDRLKARHRLILMDLRGHGRSDRPHDSSAYRMPRLVGDVTATLDSLEVPSAHFLGYSSGGWLGLGMAKFAPDRLLSLVAAGTDSEDPDPSRPSAWSESMIRLLRGPKETLMATLRSQFSDSIRGEPRPLVLESVLPLRLRLLAEADGEALAAMLECEQSEQLRFREVLPHLAFPCLFFVGENDGCLRGAKEAASLVPRARFFSLPGLGHLEAAVRSELWCPRVLGFLDEVDHHHFA